MEYLQKINWVDILVVIVVLRMSYVAFQEGLSHQIFPLFGSIFILVVSLHYYGMLGSLIAGDTGIPREIANFAAFALLAVVMGVILHFIKFLIDKIIKVEWHPAIEKFGGIITGIVKAFITASLILITLCMVPLPYFQHSIRDKSLTGMSILKVGAAIYESVGRALPVIKITGAAAKSGEIISKVTEDKAISGIPQSQRGAKDTTQKKK